MGTLRTSVADSILTPDQVAEEMSLKPETVRVLMRKGELPGVKVGGSWRTTRRAIYDHLESAMGLVREACEKRQEYSPWGVPQARTQGTAVVGEGEATAKEPTTVFFPR